MFIMGRGVSFPLEALRGLCYLLRLSFLGIFMDETVLNPKLGVVDPELLHSQRVASSLGNDLNEAIRRTKDYLLSLQHEKGYWVAELRADTTLPSDYILMMHFMGIQNSEKVRKLSNYILKNQLENGGWNIYPEGPGEISATVKAYTALKLAGFSQNEPFMGKAREAIERLGGVEKCNSFTKIYLALIGQYEWSATPAISPELMFAPQWFYFNIYEISAWSRAIVIPLCIMYAFRPVRPVPQGRGIDELFKNHLRPRHIAIPSRPFWTWKNFFLKLDSLLKFYEKRPIRFLRKMALRKAEAWMLERLEMSDGLGAIYPAIVNSIFALSSLGYANDHPLVQRALKQLEELEVYEEDALRIQPCFSPIWDTGLSLVALTEAQIEPNHLSLRKAAHWILEKEIRHFGDWQVKNPNVLPSGWSFEFRNEFYPDVDDTIMILLALKRLHDRAGKWPRDLTVQVEAAMERSMAWVRAMQNKDGGWSSFDRDNHRTIFTKVPFADHNAMLDPSSSDITGRILEVFSAFGVTQQDPQIRKAIDFLKKEQEEDGSWYGRWGVNYVYGTWQVLKGFSMMGEDMKQPTIQKAVQWLKSVQNQDGGWGESCRSYDEPREKAKGQSTPSQTSWALMGLFAAGDWKSENAKRGLDYLLKTQKADGSWDEKPYTGTGFPCVFYIKYEYYKIYFPLFALAYYARLTEQ